MSDDIHFRTFVTDPDRMRAALENNEPVGAVELLVATFGKPDAHIPVGLAARQVIDEGAFRTWIAGSNFQQDTVPIFLDHGHAFETRGIALASWKLGKATSFRESGEGLVVGGDYNLEKQVSREAFSDLVHDPTGAEFSFRWPPTEVTYRGADGYDHVSEFERVDEVSQVGLGAGAGSHVISLRAAIASHSTATSKGSWDGPAAKKALPNERAALRRAFAWVDPDGDPADKSTYKFIHHESGGAANVRACQTGIGVLNGGRGGTTIPDADRAGVYRHLAAHLRDAGLEPPALRSTLAEWGWTPEDVASLLGEPAFRDAFVPAAVSDQALRAALVEALNDQDQPDDAAAFEMAVWESIRDT